MNINPITILIGLLQKLAEHPWVYDRIQSLAGQTHTVRRISPRVSGILAKTVVEVGGGTGFWKRLWPADSRYICLDIEMPKLQGFRAKVPGGLAVLSDATRMCIASESADAVVCIAVLHHLTDAMFGQVLDEVQRILKSGGHLIVLDPVLSEQWAGRLLWRLDRGSYPRRSGELREKLQSKFRVIHWEDYSVYHEYVFMIGVKR